MKRLSATYLFVCVLLMFPAQALSRAPAGNFDAAGLHKKARMFGVYMLREWTVKTDNTADQVKRSLGSGFVIKERQKYYIVTNAHVAGDPNATYTVLFYGHNKFFEVKPIGWDNKFDLALLEFTDKDFVPFGHAELGDSDLLDAGTKLYIYGNPLGHRFLGSTGEVMSSASYNILGNEYPGGLVPMDATCNPGNSGGPILDADGKVNAVLVAIIISPRSICLGIPVNNLKVLLSKLKGGGEIKHGVMGCGKRFSRRKSRIYEGRCFYKFWSII